MVLGPAESCGEVQKKRRVARVRSAACCRVTQPRSTPMGYAVSANPTAAMLENDGVGQRSGVRPLPAGVRSQNQLNVLRCSVSRNATVSGETPGPPELPEQPPRARTSTIAADRFRRPVRSQPLRRFGTGGGR